SRIAAPAWPQAHSPPSSSSATPSASQSLRLSWQPWPEPGRPGPPPAPRAPAQQLTGGGAHAITAQAPAAARSALEHLLRTAFVHGLNAVALIGAILALPAPVVTALALRRETTARQSH